MAKKATAKATTPIVISKFIDPLWDCANLVCQFSWLFVNKKSLETKLVEIANVLLAKGATNKTFQVYATDDVIDNISGEKIVLGELTFELWQDKSNCPDRVLAMKSDDKVAIIRFVI